MPCQQNSAGRMSLPALELVKKVFLTSSQTRPTSLGSRLKRLRLAAAHSLTLARLRAEKYFCRRTRRRQKCFELYLRLRAQTLRGFFDRLKRRDGFRHAACSKRTTGCAGGIDLFSCRPKRRAPCRRGRTRKRECAGKTRYTPECRRARLRRARR